MQAGVGASPNAVILLAASLALVWATSFVGNSATWVHGWNGWLIGCGNALLLCLALFFVQRRIRTAPGLPVTGLLVVLLVSMGWACLASDSVTDSLAALVPLLGLVGVAMLSAQASAKELERIVGGVAVWGLVLCMVSLWRWLMQDVALESFNVGRVNGLLGERVFRIDWTEIRNGHPFGHQNYLAGAILLLMPFWLSLSGSDRRWGRLTGCAGLGFGFLALWSTQTRAAPPALGAMLGLLLVWTGVRRVWSRRRWLLWCMTGGALIGALMAANPRNQQIAASGDSASIVWQADVRRQMLDAGRLLLEGREWTGIGPGAVPAKYPLVRGRIDAGLEANYQLHNTPLQLVVELGWPALIMVLALLAATFIRWWRTPAHEETSRVPTGVWAGIAVFGYAVYSFTDYQLDVAGIGCLLGLAVGLVWSGSRSAETPRSVAAWPGRLGVVGVGLLFVASLMATLWIGRARWSFHEANSARLRGDGGSFVELATRAHRQDPANPFYPEKIAAWHIERLAAATNAAFVATETSAARQWLETSLAGSPDSEYARFNLGWLLLRSEPRRALLHFRRAAQLVPDRRGVYLGCALALAGLDRPEEAAQALALELVLDPGFLATANAWHREPLASLKAPALRRATSLLTTLAQETNLAASNGQWLREKAAAMAWLAGGPAPPERDGRFLGDFWKTLDAGDSSAAETMSAGAPWMLVRRAWKESSEDEAKRLLIAAAYRSGRRIPSESTLAAWMARLRIGTWSEVVRSEPAVELRSGYRRERTGYNLIARHAEGARPADVPVYEENTFFEAFFRFLAGTGSDVASPVFLRELDRIIAAQATDPTR